MVRQPEPVVRGRGVASRRNVPDKASRQPSLTSFYLMMSVGGVIGGLFCAILAPLVFNWTWEHPILILAAALLMPKTGLIPLDHDNRKIAGAMAVLGVVALTLAIYGV